MRLGVRVRVRVRVRVITAMSFTGRFAWLRAAASMDTRCSAEAPAS